MQFHTNGLLMEMKSQGLRVSLELTQVEVGKRIRLRVDYVDDNGTSESALSAETSLIANVNDTPSGV